MAKEDLTKKDFPRRERRIERKIERKELQQALIDNFINLQKVLTNLSVKFDELSGNISKLLQLFEISAKTFAEKYSGVEQNQGSSNLDKEFIKKLDALLDQNRIISKGIMLIEEKLREKTESPYPQSYPPSSQNQFPNRQMNPRPAPRY